MGSYYEHRRNEKVELPYSFQCEQCGKDSGPMVAVITGANATHNSHFKTISDAQDEKLRKQAHQYLVKEIKNVHKNVTEKKVYTSEFHDNCPFCHKPQSWAVSGVKDDMYTNPIVFLGCGIVFAVIAFFGYSDESILLPLAVFAAGAVAAIVSLLLNINKVNQKKKQTSSGAQNLPVIQWEAVQHLLNEQ
ncbi:MAG: hypothetical protein NC121_07070 [Blautia sp.]|nr:hypothetical protein [Blautia sp.]